MRNTLVLVRSKSFSLALETEGRRSLRGMPELSSLRACLKACKAARAWAQGNCGAALPSSVGGGGGGASLLLSHIFKGGA